MPQHSLDILYQDPDIVIVHKPSGLLVHPSPVDRHETRSVVTLLQSRLGQPVYPVHRLDKPTSGALLVALNSAAARKLSYQFETGQVAKTYMAIVRGWPALGGLTRHALSHIDDCNSRRRDHTRRQDALTLWHRQAICELPISADGRHPTSRYALVSLYPRTGRRHQLRRHMKHISHPIIGDSSYGKGAHNRLFRQEFQIHRLLLASTRLCFEHPSEGHKLAIDCPLASELQTLVERIDWQTPLPERPISGQ